MHVVHSSSAHFNRATTTTKNTEYLLWAAAADVVRYVVWAFVMLSFDVGLNVVEERLNMFKMFEMFKMLLHTWTRSKKNTKTKKAKHIQVKWEHVVCSSVSIWSVCWTSVYSCV